MVRTRVGYAGGSKENPTYYSLGSHSETIQIDYDPAKITYRELLEVFWNSHNPAYQSLSNQYLSIVFYHDEEQRQLAAETAAAQAARLGKEIKTLIVPYSGFYLAEDYHQKYYLQQDAILSREFARIYPDSGDFINSTAAARVNGYVGGYGTSDVLQEQLADLGLSESGTSRLLQIAGRGLQPACPVG